MDNNIVRSGSFKSQFEWVHFQSNQLDSSFNNNLFAFSKKPELLSATSEVQYIGSIPWNFEYKKFFADNTTTAVNVDLFCNPDNSSPLWKVEADFQIRTISKKEGVEDLVHKNSHCFNSKNNHCLTSISSILYPDFVSANKIEFEVSIEIKKAVGFRCIETDFSKPTSLTDVVLVVGGKKIHVNKSFLAVHSSVFRAMFFSGFKEEKEKEIEMKDVEYDELIDLLTIIQPGGEVPIHKDNLEYLLELADRFDIHQVVHLCAKYLMTTTDIDNCRKFEIADKYLLTELHGQVLKLLTRQDITRLRNGDEFDYFKTASKDGLIDRLLQI